MWIGKLHNPFLQLTFRVWKRLCSHLVPSTTLLIPIPDHPSFSLTDGRQQKFIELMIFFLIVFLFPCLCIRCCFLIEMLRKQFVLLHNASMLTYLHMKKGHEGTRPYRVKWLFIAIIQRLTSPFSCLVVCLLFIPFSTNCIKLLTWHRIYLH